MKKTIGLFILGFSVAVTQAAVIKFSVTPGGLSPANEVPAVTNSTGSGNAISGGVSLETSNSTLTFAIGYGSAAGFTDLTGPATGLTLNGPAPTTGTAAVLFDLTPFSFTASDPAKGGILFGSISLTSDQSSNLLAGLEYINIATATNAAGEIRGQLVNLPPSLTCPGDATLECTGQPINLTAHVADAEGDALQVVWTLNGAPVQTNSVAQGSGTNGVDVVLPASLVLGTNIVMVTVSDSASNQTTCSSTIILQDTTPPVITGSAVSPSVLWPPNHKLVPVKVTVQTHDNCCTAKWKIISVTSNEPVNGQGDGDTGPDWVIKGDHGLSLRAERSGKGSGRIYTITVQAEDCAGNLSATKTLTVKVPHDQGHDH